MVGIKRIDKWLGERLIGPTQLDIFCDDYEVLKAKHKAGVAVDAQELKIYEYVLNSPNPNKLVNDLVITKKRFPLCKTKVDLVRKLKWKIP